jgi:hypothetical protein
MEVSNFLTLLIQPMTPWEIEKLFENTLLKIHQGRINIHTEKLSIFCYNLVAHIFLFESEILLTSILDNHIF